jgi:fibronectin type 3 domain-containing protein
LNIHGEGPSSDVVYVTPAAVPDAPTNLQLLSADENQITFSWDAPYDGGKSIDEYQIWWDSGDSSPFEIVQTVSPSITEYQIQAGILTGYYYQFYVIANNEIGDSLASETVTYIASDTPDAPRDVQKVTADASHITILWLVPLDNGGSSVTNYKVYQDGAEITPAEGTSGLTQWTTNSVSAGNTHTFEVSAVNARGEGVKSSPAVSIIAATVPFKP